MIFLVLRVDIRRGLWNLRCGDTQCTDRNASKMRDTQKRNDRLLSLEPKKSRLEITHPKIILVHYGLCTQHTHTYIYIYRPALFHTHTRANPHIPAPCVRRPVPTVVHHTCPCRAASRTHAHLLACGAVGPQAGVGRLVRSLSRFIGVPNVTGGWCRTWH
jgi:hypothetical protein